MLACAGDVPTLETLAAAALLREHLPDLRVRVVNVVDLMRLQPETEHPHGLSDREFDALFTADRPVIFAYHGYPWLIHRLTYRRANHDNLHVRGYKEEGTTTTPFDMVMLNDLDRFHLVMDVIDRVPGLGDARPPRCARRWSTSGLRHRAYTARARRGPARRSRDWALARLSRVRVLVVNAGLEQPEAARSLDAGRRGRWSTRARRAARPTSTATPLGDARPAAAPSTPSGTGSSTAATRFTRAGRDRRRASSPSSTRSPTLAPLHQPPVARRARRGRGARCPALPAVACFDTAFHATLPGGRGDLRAARASGASAAALRRYGFHGLSHAYASRRAASCRRGRRGAS